MEKCHILNVTFWWHIQKTVQSSFVLKKSLGTKKTLWGLMGGSGSAAESSLSRRRQLRSVENLLIVRKNGRNPTPLTLQETTVTVCT